MKKKIESAKQQTGKKAERLNSKPRQSAGQMKIRKWLAIRKKAARKIDPETAEVDWIYAQVIDPYGVYPEPPEEYDCVGREYFARSPGSDIWVSFGDLSAATSKALWEKHKAKLAFPAGLEPLLSVRN